MEKSQIICEDTSEKDLSSGTFILCLSCISGVKVMPKSHQLPILFILAASLILNTNICI